MSNPHDSAPAVPAPHPAPEQGAASFPPPTFAPPIASSAAWTPPPLRPPRAPFEPPTGSRWGILDAVIGVVFFFAVLLLVPFAAQYIPLEESDLSAAQFWLSLVSYGLVVAFLVVVSRARGQRSLSRDFGLSFKLIDIPIGLGIGILAKTLSAIFVVIAAAITGSFPKSGNVDLGPDPLWGALFGILIGSLLAPLVEELFFRGLVLRAVRHSILRGRGREQPAAPRIQAIAISSALVASAAVFAVMHLQPVFDPALLIALALSTFVFGILNGAITVITGRLGSAIIAHVFFNGIAIAVLLAFGGSLPEVPA